MSCTEVSIRAVEGTGWIKLAPGLSSIGRKKTNEVYIDNPKCSRVHATVLWQGQHMPILEVTGRTPIFFEDGGLLKPGQKRTVRSRERFFLHGNPSGWVRESLLEVQCAVSAEANHPPLETPSPKDRPSVGVSESSPGESQCPICMETMKNQAGLNGCTHKFCFECIKAWTKVENKCPLCKASFLKIATRSGSHMVTPRKQRCVDSSGEAASLWINEMVCSECSGAHDEQLLIICDGGCGAAQHSYWEL
eukprot:TRINITY_DN14329_c0_g1_i2.p1 TRINITY_DN14329_c0_g1~~TRINITY_DN14329_c0_g1_i2.p1  ORF type:complete len:249 (+),score=29.51 TRINITY_DN14329_c0_g1_i2:248-994(+)